MLTYMSPKDIVTPCMYDGKMEVAYDEEKLVEMVLHVAGRLQDEPAGGATKLNKILFFAEFTHLRRHCQAISGCEFQKLDHGPAPRQMLPVRSRLIESGEAELVSEDFLGRLQHRLVPLREANLDVFTEEELETIEHVLDLLAGMTGTHVSDLSHREPGWRLTEFGETIPFAAAFLPYEQFETPTSARVSKSVAERYGIETAK